MAGKTEWNAKYLRGCIEKATALLTDAGADDPALELLRNAAKHLECRDKCSCKAYRASLAKAIAELRRERQKQRKNIKAWERWVFEAAEAVLHPIPGCKHRATVFLRNAIAEYDESLGHYPSALADAFGRWLDQHGRDVPPYVPSLTIQREMQ